MTTRDLLTEARRLFAAGVPLLPNDATERHPKRNGWQKGGFTWPQIECHVKKGGALGDLQGGDREGVDLDSKHWLGNPAELRDGYEQLVEDNAPGLLARLVIVTTPSGGRHYRYRCSLVGANQKLAERPTTAEELDANPQVKIVTLIETRGAGGQFMIPPSPGYTILQGDLADLPVITAEERGVLLACARPFNQVAKKVVTGAPKTYRGKVQGDGRPGDHYNSNGGADEALDLLEADGWVVTGTRGGTVYLRRPGKSSGVSATYGHIAPGIFYCFTSNGSPFDPNTSYTPFAVRALLKHGGDYAAAAKELAERYEMPYYPEGEPLDQDGALCCPRHKRPLRASNRDGWFHCTAKAGNAYCTYSARILGYEPPATATNPNGAVINITDENLGRATDDVWAPIIDITDENLGRATDAIWAAIMVSPYGPNLYRFGTEITHLGDKLTTVDDVLWRGMVNRAASFVTTKQGKAGHTTTEVIPPLAMIRDSLVFAPDTLPVIERLSPLPIFDPRGKLLTNGYYADSRTLVLSDIAPKRLHPAAALSLILDDILVDFPFASPADRANAVAYLLMPFIRELCGAVPVFLIDAAQRGTGKTLLNDLVHMIWTGAPAPLSDLPLNAEEQRKAITTHLIGAPVSVVFDDISMLAGHALQRAVTGQVWTDRMLGANKEVSVPIRTIWAATGNNVTLGGDMVRRTVLIRLESSEEHPSQRTSFKRSESELREWVRENRAHLVSACTSLVAHGLAHGRPGGVTLGGFDQFAQVVTRILDGIGVHGFCKNLTAVLAREDGRQSGWKAIVKRWWDDYGTKPLKAGEVATLIETDEDSEIILDGETPRARATTAGKLLKSRLGAVFAYEGLRVRLAITRNTKGDTLYRLEEIRGDQLFSASESFSGHREHSEHSFSPYPSDVRAYASDANGAAMSATFAMSATSSGSRGFDFAPEPTAEIPPVMCHPDGLDDDLLAVPHSVDVDEEFARLLAEEEARDPLGESYEGI